MTEMLIKKDASAIDQNRWLADLIAREEDGSPTVTVRNRRPELPTRILFFVDPLIDNGDRLFRFPTLKYHVPVLMAGIQRQLAAGSMELRLLASEELVSHARTQGVGGDWPWASVSARELARTIKTGETAARLWQRGNPTDAHLSAYRDAIKRALDGFVPDVVIVYESAAPYLKQLFPSAIVVNETWGMFSRPPMPALTTFDPAGTYQNSTLYKFKEQLRAMEITPPQREVMNKVRSLVAEPLFAMDPCYEQVLAAKVEFRKLVLLPLQIDDYFSFTECSDYPSHEALIDFIFETLPDDIGVIVTQHQDHKPVLSEADISQLRARYRNFVYFDDLVHVPMLSSFIVNYVDGVITTSSAVGLHAALMKIPVFVAGRSHISVVSSGNISDVERVLTETPEVDWDPVLYWILTRYQVFTEVDQAVPENFSQLLRSFLRFEGDGLDAFERRYTDDQLLRLFDCHSRTAGLEKIFRSKGVTFRRNELYWKIAQAQIVSFDLFDTLVERPFVEPHYLFQLIEPRIRRELGLASFAYMRFRRMAEEAARKERGWKETTLGAIYRHFQELTGLSAEQCAAIAAIELDAEKRVLKRREPIYHAMSVAKKLGRVVSILTDIYLEEGQIRELLTAVSIEGFDHLLVSATEDMRKHDGTMFAEYVGFIYQNYRVKPDGRSLLHIGDNGHADCDMAKPFNIRAHVIPKSIDAFKRSRWGKVFETNLRKRFVLSDVLAGVIANRFGATLEGRNSDTLFGDSLFRAGYAAAGPMLFSFVQWLIRRVREQKYEKVQFLARDGYLLKQIYDRIRDTGVYHDLPPSGYLHVSRRAAAVPALFNWSDIVGLYHLSFGNRKLGDFIESRFGLPKHRIDPAILKEHGYGINDVIYQSQDVKRHLELLESLSGAILANAENERDAMIRYLAENGLVTGREHVCVVDIGYSASIQKYINQILDDGAIAGYYMLTHEAARRSFDGVICEAFYNSYDEQRMADCHPLNDYVFLFESVLSSSEGSVVRHRYDTTGLWTMDTRESNRETERRRFMTNVHAGVCAFAQDLLRVTGPYLDDIPLGPYLGSKPFFHLAMHPSKRDALLFRGLKVENGFGGGDAWLVYDATPFLGKDGKLTGKARDIALGSSQWKEAAHAAYTANALPVSPAEAKSNGQAPARKPQGPAIFSAGASSSSATQQHSRGELVSLRTKNIDLPPAVRKYLKFQRDPYRFFADSRNPMWRSLRIFYRRYRIA